MTYSAASRERRLALAVLRGGLLPYLENYMAIHPCLMHPGPAGAILTAHLSGHASRSPLSCPLQLSSSYSPSGCDSESSETVSRRTGGPQSLQASS